MIDVIDAPPDVLARIAARKPAATSPDCPMSEHCYCGPPAPDDEVAVPHRYGSRGCRRARREARARGRAGRT